MRVRSTVAAALTIAFLLAGLPLESGAGGVPPATLASCQTAQPSGPPVRITLVLSIDFANAIVNSITLFGSFRGQPFGPFTGSNIPYLSGLSQMDVGCTVFAATNVSVGTPLSLQDQILLALGIAGNVTFTACSFLGSDAEDCGKGAGIYAPAGWAGGSITGFISR